MNLYLSASADSIRFPHLGINLSHVGDHISVFGFDIAYYGMIIACGILLASWLILKETRRLGISEDDMIDIIMGGVLCGVIGARIYYVLFSLDYYSGRWAAVFNLREGGLAIFGGIIGGALAVYFITKKKKLSFFGIGDIVILGVPTGQIMGRWGNFFNREAFGDYTDSLFAMLIPIDSVRQQDAVTSEMTAHLVTADGLDWISVHPTFLYESLWNIGVFLILYFVVRKRKTWEGQILFSYLLLYGAGRFWIEGLRTDQLQILPGLAVSQVIAALCVVVAAGKMMYMKNEESA